MFYLEYGYTKYCNSFDMFRSKKQNGYKFWIKWILFNLCIDVLMPINMLQTQNGYICL
jgi:hypothetical protein